MPNAKRGDDTQQDARHDPRHAVGDAACRSARTFGVHPGAAASATPSVARVGIQQAHECFLRSVFGDAAICRATAECAPEARVPRIEQSVDGVQTGGLCRE